MMHTEYLRTLFALQRELTREIDRAQLGEEPAEALAELWYDVLLQRLKVIG